MRTLFSVLVFVMCAAAGRSQRLPALTFKAKAVSIQYENDLFGHTDYYYTQGLQLTFNDSALQRFFLARALPHFAGNIFSAGIAVGQDCYTPMSILSDTVLKGDRPFAAGLMLHYHIASSRGRSTLTSRLSAGIVGAAAGGYEMQRGIHENTSNIIPHGWQYQIRNDAIVNYEAAYSYELIALTGGENYLVPQFLVNGSAIANVGTYLDKVSVGVSVYAGVTNKRSRPDFWLTYQARVSAVGYDATLQGGLFNRSSPYTMSADQIDRVTFQQRAGVLIALGPVQVQGSYTMLSREFKSGKSHAWGGLSAAVTF